MSEKHQNQFQEYVNSKERATKSNAIEVPSISLLQGGEAIKGIDKNFFVISVKAVNGSGSLSVSLPLSMGVFRNVFNNYE